MNNMPYGWRGKIGLIYIASAFAMETEFVKMSPPGVTTHTTRVALSNNPEQFTINDLIHLKDDVLEAARLLAQAPLQSIAFGCTSGSFAKGIDYDKELIDQMESITSIPCTTTTTAVLNAFNSLGVNKIAIATPYTLPINELAYKYFTDSGLTITNMTGLGIMNDYKISRIDLKTIYRSAIDTVTVDTEAIFISCTGLSTLPIIQALEEDLKIPVITSNQATFWYALKIANINSNQSNFGKLFES